MSMYDSIMSVHESAMGMYESAMSVYIATWYLLTNQVPISVVP